MAMLPFCGYHMGDYFAHWLKMGEKGGAKMPKIFYVNWFRKNDDGKFMWPGYGENSRVLKWIFERCDGTAEAVDTPIGKMPTDGLDTEGLDVGAADIEELLRVDSRRLEIRDSIDQGALPDLRRQAAAAALKDSPRSRNVSATDGPQVKCRTIASCPASCRA